MEDASSSDVLSSLLTIGLILGIIAASTGALAFWLFMLYNQLHNPSLFGKKRIAWMAGTIILPPLAIIYYFTAHSRRNQQIS